MSKIAAIILAAGNGRRMKSSLPKPFHALAGLPMVAHAARAVAGVGLERLVVVAARETRERMAALLPEAEVVVQEAQLGTGDAVKAARAPLEPFDGDILILYADTALIRPASFEAMLAARRGGADPAVVVLGFRPDEGGRYGRLVLDADGGLERIVEYKDGTAAEQALELCNSGVMAVDGGVLFELLDELDNDNAQGEFYLTDIVARARARDRPAAVVEAAAAELMGIDTRADLAQAEALVQDRLRQRAMAAGVTLADPSSVYFSHDTEIAADVVIHPQVVFGAEVKIAAGAEIHSYSHLEGCTVGPGARIGPFARLRPEAVVGPDVRIGNFVEIKKSVIEEGAKVNHLSYIGDARVGAAANIGAGTITCNFDGFNKSHTDIGAGAFIGSNTALVAPVRIGEGAIIGAGSVISEAVADDALAVTRPPRKERLHVARKDRERKAAA